MTGVGADRPVHSSAAELRGRLEASRKALMDAIAGLDEEGFRIHSDASEWSTAEVLAHLLTTEGAFMQGARAALAKEDFVITPRTQDERQKPEKWAQRMAVPQILHGLLAQRRDTLHVLEEIPPEQLVRKLHHPRWGELTLAWLFQRTAEHEEEHAAQVRALRVQPERGGRNLRGRRTVVEGESG